MLRRILALGLISIILMGTVSCGRREKAKKISLERKEAVRVEKGQAGEKPLRIAVGAMITPRAGFAYYRQLLDYIAEKLERPVQFVDKETYAEINDLMRLGNIV